MTNTAKSACFHYVTAWWNGTKVCDGHMSSVMAYALAREMAESFNGPAGRDALAQTDMLLARLLDLSVGRRESLVFTDDTTTAALVIERVPE